MVVNKNATLQLLCLMLAISVGARPDADIDVSFMAEYATDYCRSALRNGGLARALDNRSPRAYQTGSARDFGVVVEFAWDILDADTQTTIVTDVQALKIPASTSSSHAELAAQVWLFSILTNRTRNGTMMCERTQPLWLQLQSQVYQNASTFRDGLIFSPVGTMVNSGYGGVLTDGHDLLFSIQHVQALLVLGQGARYWNCSNVDAVAVDAVRDEIVKALAGPLLWDENSGMYRATTGSSNMTIDVVGTAMAGTVCDLPSARLEKIKTFLTQYWDVLTQDGLVRTLPKPMHWPSVVTQVPLNTYTNGGYFGQGVVYVLHLIATTDATLAASLVRDAVSVARRSGLSEWRNTQYCCNCAGAATWKALTPYPSTASFTGVTDFGGAIVSVYAAATKILSHAPTIASASGVSITTDSRDRDRGRGRDQRRHTHPSLHTRASDTQSSITRNNDALDADLAWLTQYAAMYQAEARICGTTSQGGVVYNGCYYPPAADPARPAAYSLLWTRDFTYTMVYLWDVLDDVGRQTAYNQTTWILKNRPVVRNVGSNDEPMFQTFMLCTLANATQDKQLFCDNVQQLWHGLQLIYNSSNFQDGLIFTPTPQTGYGFTDSIPKSGHHMFDSVLHVQALRQLASLSLLFGCGEDAKSMTMVGDEIVTALNGDILWNETSGMYRPCSGNAHNLTDVWASALAVHLGNVISVEREQRVIDWFGANWHTCVQSGQIRHLPIDEYWPQMLFWEHDTYQNGGYWGTASGWVLPVIGRNSSSLAQSLVRDAIDDARSHGLNEWKNSMFQAGYGNSADINSFASNPVSGDWFGGAMAYGPNIGSVFAAATLLLGSSSPTPAPPPSPSPPPPRPPIGCNVTGQWRFYSQSANASETNGFAENEAGAVLLTPGRNDEWKTAIGQFHSDWTLPIVYEKTIAVACVVQHSCSLITCPDYTYSRESWELTLR